MLLAHHPDALAQLRPSTTNDPLRVLISGCLAAWPCGVDGSDNGLGGAIDWLLSLPSARVIPFCPEQHGLGVPRTTPDIHGGDGIDVLEGRASVLDEHSRDLTAAMIEGARAMLALAQAENVELAILTDMSAACGSQVISLGCRFQPRRRYQRGVGVAAAMLLRARIPIVSQRDFATLGRLRHRLDPTYVLEAGAQDHHQHPWTQANLPGQHPRRDGA